MNSPHVLKVQTQHQRLEIDRLLPYRDVAYRGDRADLGLTVTLTAEIRESTRSNAALKIEMIRRLNDGVARVLDLQDGETLQINAKLLDPQYELNTQTWFEGERQVPYSVRFLQVE